MANIRINELARELAVKSNAVLEYLAEIGTPNKQSHSSVLDDGLADKVRKNFRFKDQAKDGEANSQAGKIRVNELARELEVQSHVVIDYLAELGIPEKKGHSSLLDDELADRVRKHFMLEGEGEPVQHEGDNPMRRSIAEIKAAARKAVGPKKPR